MRGEYDSISDAELLEQELPPRARRILINNQFRFVHIGTTSACAENTSHSFFFVILSGNYLRVRGEYHGAHIYISGGQELPPRARRIHVPPFDQIIAAVKVDEKNPISKRSLRSAIKESDSKAVPTKFCLVSAGEWPITKRGKLDSQALIQKIEKDIDHERN